MNNRVPTFPLRVLAVKLNRIGNVVLEFRAEIRVFERISKNLASRVSFAFLGSAIKRSMAVLRSLAIKCCSFHSIRF